MREDQVRVRRKEWGGPMTERGEPRHWRGRNGTGQGQPRGVRGGRTVAKTGERVDSPERWWGRGRGEGDVSMLA